MIESLVALFIQALILLLVGFTFQTLKTFQTNLNQDKNIEWHLFLNQFEHDMIDKRLHLRGRSEVFFIVNDSDTRIDYVWQGADIIRKKNGTGYVPMLMGIRNIRYSDGEGGIHVEVMLLNQQTMGGFIPVERTTKDE